MSEYWDLKCMTCDATCGLDNLNHYGERLNALLKIRVAPEFATDLDKYDHDHGALDYEPMRVPEWVCFLSRHHGHSIAAWSEYGRAFTECGERVNCTECGHDERCALPRGHAETIPHSPRRKL